MCFIFFFQVNFVLIAIHNKMPYTKNVDLLSKIKWSKRNTFNGFAQRSHCVLSACTQTQSVGLIVLLLCSIQCLYFLVILFSTCFCFDTFKMFYLALSEYLHTKRQQQQQQLNNWLSQYNSKQLVFRIFAKWKCFSVQLTGTKHNRFNSTFRTAMWVCVFVHKTHDAFFRGFFVVVCKYWTFLMWQKRNFFFNFFTHKNGLFSHSGDYKVQNISLFLFCLGRAREKCIKRLRLCESAWESEKKKNEKSIKQYHWHDNI